MGAARAVECEGDRAVRTLWIQSSGGNLGLDGEEGRTWSSTSLGDSESARRPVVKARPVIRSGDSDHSCRLGQLSLPVAALLFFVGLDGLEPDNGFFSWIVGVCVWMFQCTSNLHEFT